MSEQISGGTSAADALDIAVGTAIAAALPDDAGHETAAPTELPPDCLNCGSVVRGRYCVDCGQITDTHVPTLAEVLGDALTSIFNLDSRLWRTLLTLFCKPGRLTQDYLDGKRARYVPPLRLYLVLSVLVFLVVSLDPTNYLEDAPGFDLTNTSLTPQEADELERQIDAAVEARVAAALGQLPEADAASDAAEEDAAVDPDPDFRRGVDFGQSGAGDLTLTDPQGRGVTIDDGYDCEEMTLPGVARGGVIDGAIREACLEGRADDFDSIADAFRDNVPLLAFMVIPVMAVIFKLFYLLSGRNYLAHLVFLCHTHAFTFLLFVVLTLLRIVGAAYPALHTATSVIGVALFGVYLPVYYFLAMRRVYAQGVVLTFVKQVTLMLIYLFAVSVVFTAGFIVVMLAS